MAAPLRRSPARPRTRRTTGRAPRRPCAGAALNRDLPGRFVFDLNTVDAVGTGHADTMVADDHVAVVRTTFDPPTRVLTFEAIIFRLQDTLWKRSDVHLLQRCHEEQEVRDALTEAGLVDIDVVPSEEVGHRPGRLFYAARAPR